MASQIASVSDDQAAQSDANYQAELECAVQLLHGLALFRHGPCFGFKRRVKNGGNTKTEKDGEVEGDNVHFQHTYKRCTLITRKK
jgi:hypothetical protein